MLLIDDCYAEMGEHHGVFEDGMCAHQYLDISTNQSIEHFLALLSLHHTREQFHPDVHPLEKFTDGLQVLFGKNFGRSHQTGLITVVEGDEHGHQRHEGFTRTHVALQQPVHLSAAAHIGTDFMHHPFLCAREFERKMVGIEIMEDVADAVEDVATVFAPLVARVP